MKFVNKHYKKIIVLISLLSLVPLFMISYYSRPSADDYSYSRYVIGMINSGDWNIFGLIAKAIEVDILEWKTYDGPFISQIFMTLQPGIFGEKYYGWGAVVLMILIYLLLVATYKNIGRIISNYMNNCFSKSAAWFFGLLTTAIVLNGMPSIVEGIYWFDGAWNYLPFFFLMVYTISLILRYMHESQGPFGKGITPILKIIAICVLSFISSGGNYIVTYANVLLTFTIAIYAILKKKRIYILPFIFAFGGFCLEFFSPGRMIRSDHMGNGLLFTIAMVVKGLYMYLAEWIDIRWIMMMILVMAFTFCLWDEGMSFDCKINPLWLVLYTFVIECALLCLPYYATKGLSERIVNIVWMVFMFMSAICLVYFMEWLRAKNVIGQTSGQAFCIVAIVAIMGATLYNSSNSVISFREINKGVAAKYAAQCDERYERMKLASPGDELETLPIEADSRILYFDDLSPDENDWVNEAWRDYYGVGMHIVYE